VNGAVPNDGAHKPDCFRAPQNVNAPYSEGCRQVQRRLPAAARRCRGRLRSDCLLRAASYRNLFTQRFARRLAWLAKSYSL